MKALVALLSSEKTEYVKRLLSCEETWVPYTPDWAKVMVVTGPRLGVPDDYDMMSYKIVALFRRALMIPNWEFLLRVDDDVFVNWSKVQIPGFDYAGPEVPRRDKDKFSYCAGAVTWLSRKAVEILFKNMKPAKGVIEDREIGRVLHEAHIDPAFLTGVYTLVKGQGQVALSSQDISQVKASGFTLETGSPKMMERLIEVTGLVRVPTGKNSMDPSPVPSSPPPPSGPSVFRDQQGRLVQRRDAIHTIAEKKKTFEDKPVIGGAVARPQIDPGWRKK